MSLDEGNSKETTIENNNNGVSKEILEHPYVKDLLVKFDILNNLLVKERQTNSELTTKLKNCESELNTKIIRLKQELDSKTNQTKILIKEKFELDKKVKQLQKKKGGFFDVLNLSLNSLNTIGQMNDPGIDPNIVQKQKEEGSNNPNSVEAVSALANEEMQKLYDQISQLKFENETYMKKMNDSLEQTENAKLKYKNDLKTYTDKIKKLDESNKLLEGEKKELQDRIQLTSTISSQSMKELEHFKLEVEHYKELVKGYKKDKEEAVNKLNEFVEKCNKLSEENENYKKEIQRGVVDSFKMAQKLSELKNHYIKVNLRNQVFHVKKVGFLSYTDMDIIFGMGGDGNYVMRIDENDETAVVNIQDVEYINRVEDYKNKVEIGYMLNGKKYDITVLVHELVVDQFIEAYKNFYCENMKNENDVFY